MLFAKGNGGGSGAGGSGGSAVGGSGSSGVVSGSVRAAEPGVPVVEPEIRAIRAEAPEAQALPFTLPEPWPVASPAYSEDDLDPTSGCLAAGRTKKKRPDLLIRPLCNYKSVAYLHCYSNFFIKS
jgi:hypothetical protein